MRAESAIRRGTQDNFGGRDRACEVLAPKSAAKWEAAVAMHLDATASDGLRTLCSQPFVKTTDLEKEAMLIGLGLQWRFFGIIEPIVGRRLTNLALANELLTKLEFTKEKWAAFGIVDLHVDDYMKLELDGVSSYFKPVVIGMDREEVHSALAFLHSTGSVLHYGSTTQELGCEVQETVFMQPQFIIDAIKYVIREAKPEDVNNELRALTTQIRNKRDLKLYFESGELTRGLLTEVWDLAMGLDGKPTFKRKDHKLMLDLLKGFKLLRTLGGPCDAKLERYVVPAMLPNKALPPEYVTPEWWCPEKAVDAADMVDDSESSETVKETFAAEMRVVYEVLGGRLPFSFMSELQVSLALDNSTILNPEHFAPETYIFDPVVDRVAGSVLSQTYKCGGVGVTEWVVVSQRAKSCLVSTAHEDIMHDSAVPDAIRVMAWVEFKTKTSKRGATDWRLLKRVMLNIERAEGGVPGLSLRRLVLYVNAQGMSSCLKEMMGSVQPGIFVKFKFQEESQKHEENVLQAMVLPQENVETCLVQRQVVRTRAHPAVQKCTAEGKVICGAKNHVEAFIAKTLSDKGMDVHAEGQLIARILLNAACGWDSTQHPQPTLSDLRLGIQCATQRNVKIVHLAGHGKRDCGFVWNTNDAATTTMETDIETLADIISKASGQNGSIECAVLNACSTKQLGEQLKKGGMSHVVCWTTPVHDEAARELCDNFYRALMEQTKEGVSDPRDYRRAFDTAVAAMRKLSVNEGIHYCPDESIGTVLGTEISMLRQQGADAKSSQSQLEPLQSEDVIQFLSKDGNSSPIHLWRKRVKLYAPSDAAREREKTGTTKPTIIGFFVKKRTDVLGVLCEAQKLTTLFQDGRSKFIPQLHAEPTFEIFQDALLHAHQNNVRIVHLAGHGRSSCGLFWLKAGSATEYEQVSKDRFAKLFQPEATGTQNGTVECVFLNACETESVGKLVRKYGVPHVICWRTPVDDTTATNFAGNFYTALDLGKPEARDYQAAFQRAVVRMADVDVSGAVDVVLFLSKDGDIVPPPVIAQPEDIVCGIRHGQKDASSPRPPADAETSPNRSDQAALDYFNVHLSKACAGDVSAGVEQVLLQEFASWSPGPVLFAQDEQVKLVLKAAKSGTMDVFKKYRGCIGNVVKHSIDTPQLVQVRLEATASSPSEILDVLSSSLRSTARDKTSTARTNSMLAKVHVLEASLDPGAASEASTATIIGYSEFRSQRRLEREYWIALSPLTCALGEIASGEPDHNLLVMHVEFGGSSLVAHSSQVRRASLRHTRSVVRRAHQDKCRVCHECAQRAACDKCLMSSKAFAKHETCGACQSCNHCTEFKWDKTYGILSPPPLPPPSVQGLPLEDLKRVLGKCESRCDPLSMFSKSIKFRERRFAFVLGNDSYTHLNTLNNCVSGAKGIEEDVRKLGFAICNDRVLENQTKQDIEREFVAWACMLPRDAVALVYIAAHGRELDGDQFVMPVDFTFEGDDIVSNVKAACVSLSWMRERLNHVLRQNGLILLFWDCCREDDKEHNTKQQIVRGEDFEELVSQSTQEVLEKEFTKLATAAELHGGHRHAWQKSWADLHARISRLDHPRHVPSCRGKAPESVANDSLITGVEHLKTQIQQFSPPDWPGCIEVFAAMHASLALDGVQGAAAQDAAAPDTSPLVNAMRTWFADKQLVKCHVHDSVVIKHIADCVQNFSDRQQRAEWRISGNTNFRFGERESNDMELD